VRTRSMFSRMSCCLLALSLAMGVAGVAGAAGSILAAAPTPLQQQQQHYSYGSSGSGCVSSSPRSSSILAAPRSSSILAAHGIAHYDQTENRAPRCGIVRESPITALALGGYALDFVYYHSASQFPRYPRSSTVFAPPTCHHPPQFCRCTKTRARARQLGGR
jgi:hypothetical protein